MLFWVIQLWRISLCVTVHYMSDKQKTPMPKNLLHYFNEGFSLNDYKKKKMPCRRKISFDGFKNLF